MLRSKPSIALVVAVAENGVIGRNGALPWRIPSDLKVFRRLTLGKPMLMGRKTFQSIGRPLDGRDNIVITRGTAIAPAPDQRLYVAPSLEEALALAYRLAAAAGVDEVAVIGGGEIFREVLPVADRVYFTRVHATVAGDATFPPLDPAAWSETAREPLLRGEQDDFAATLLTYDRRAGQPQAALATPGA